MRTLKIQVGEIVMLQIQINVLCECALSPTLGIN